MTKIMFLCATLTMAFATASTHNIVFYENATINGKEVKAGEYKMEIEGDKISIKKGKTSVEASVKVENAGDKFSTTSVRYGTEAGKYKIQEIRVGGTDIKLTVNEFPVQAVR